jgi:outer membrane receptor protein involved in Fe transport
MPLRSRGARRGTRRLPLAALLAALLLVPAALPAQATGLVTGTIADAASGAPIAGAAVQVVGTTLGTTSDEDGRYVVGGVPVGTVTLQVRRIGYAPRTVTGLMLEQGRPLRQDVALASAAIQHGAQVVTAAERGTVREALDAQRNATAIVNAVTAEQIGRSADANAAQAVRRVSGVTVQDGRYVEVRGLGERYVTASLNGARLPSPEPERRVVPLDLFPSALLQSVTTTKTFTPDLPGDFTGAQVDVRLREFPLRRTTTFSTSLGFNTAATGRDVLQAPTTGSEWLALAGRSRQLPGALAAAGELGSPGITQGDMNGFVRSLRNVWRPEHGAGAPNASLSASTGGATELAGRRLGYVGSASYATRQEIRANETRARAVVGSDGGTTPYNAYTGSTGRQSVLWGGLLNLTALLGDGSKVELNNSYTRSADNDAHVDVGTFEELDLPVERTTLDLVERSVRSNQLRGEHLLGARQTLKWSVTSAGVTRDNPDRSDIVYGQDVDPATGQRLPMAWVGYRPDFTKRAFGSLSEHGLTTDASYALRLGRGARETLLQGGAYVRHTTRDADTRVYDITGRLANDARQAEPETIFADHAGDSDAVFTVQSNSNGGSYTARDRVLAGYAMAEYPLTARVSIVAGARVEHNTMDVRTQAIGFDGIVRADLDDTDLLPSLVVNVGLTDAQKLRLAASRTLSRPEYRELSPFGYRDLIEEINVRGNPELRRSLVTNLDVRWEWYPDAGELLSVGVFYKDFDAPIEQIEIATTGVNERGYVNAAGARNYGLELELRKELAGLGAPFAPFALFSNATLMRSRISAGGGPSALTNAHRPMVGQAPYVVNAGLTYTSAGDALSATLLYNVLGRRIVSAGVDPLPDVYELPRNAVDLSLRYALREGLSLRLDGRNLLDEAYRQRQGSVLRSSYRSGRQLTVGLSWQR